MCIRSSLAASRAAGWVGIMAGEQLGAASSCEPCCGSWRLLPVPYWEWRELTRSDEASRVQRQVAYLERGLRAASREATCEARPPQGNERGSEEIHEEGQVLGGDARARSWEAGKVLTTAAAAAGADMEGSGASTASPAGGFALSDTSTLAELRAFIRERGLAVKTAGAGRTKRVILEEIARAVSGVDES